MKATFTKSHGNKVVIVTRGQIYEYFDQKEKIQ